MKKLILLISLFISMNSVMGQVPWDNGNLVVSENSRYLQHTNGKPFFWLGDIGWLLFQRLNREQAKLPEKAEETIVSINILPGPGPAEFLFSYFPQI